MAVFRGEEVNKISKMIGRFLCLIGKHDMEYKDVKNSLCISGAYRCKRPGCLHVEYVSGLMESFYKALKQIQKEPGSIL